jgi:hypothetical protein
MIRRFEAIKAQAEELKKVSKEDLDVTELKKAALDISDNILEELT